MRKLLLAGLAGMLMAGPVMAQPWQGSENRREWRDDRRDDRWDSRRDDRWDNRREWRERADWQHDRRDDRRDWRDDRRDWRDDRRDWREDRRDWRWNGTRFRGPLYSYPRGHDYRPWGVGYRLPQPYFANRYFIGDPGYYRLPRAYRGTRWVRVGPDALLISVYDGIILQAVRGLYW